MKFQQSILAEHMAFLLSIPPESNLAKLLKLCLAAKYDGDNLGKDSLEMSRELMKDPSSLPYWIQEVIKSDHKYGKEEVAAFGEMELKNTDEYMKKLWAELESLDC